MADNVYIIGGGGHAKVIYEALLTQESYNIEAYVNLARSEYFDFLKLTYVDQDSIVFNAQKEIYMVNGVGINKNKGSRKAIFLEYKKNNYNFVKVIHSCAIISRTAVLSEGVQVLARCVIQASARIGVNTIINNGAIIEHDVNVGAHCHVASGAILSGGVTVEDDVFIGAGAIILPGINIASHVTVGAGAVVTKNIIDEGTYMGMPSRKV